MADEPADAMRSDDAWFRELADGAGDVVSPCGSGRTSPSST
jgi:hypothetical protein